MSARTFIRLAWISGILFLGLAAWFWPRAPRPAPDPELARQKASRRAAPAVQAVRARLPRPLPLPETEGPAIHLRAGILVPSGPQTGASPLVHARPSARGYPWMVTFAGPIQPEWRMALESAGGHVRAYLPDQTLLVEATPESLAIIGRLPHVTWSGEYLPAHKIQPLLAGLAREDPALPLPITIQTFAPDDVAGLVQRLAAAGASAVCATPAKRWGLVRAVLPARAAIELASLPEVQWIEHHELPKILNDVALAADRLNVQAAHDEHGLDGAGQIVAIADTGLDTGNTNDLHPDFAGRLLQVFDTGRLTNWSDTYYHGTHVAGSLLGSGAASGGQYRGAAPAAQLVFQSIMTASQTLALPDDLNDLYAPPYDLGARIHSDSWGSPVEGEYTTDSMTTDEFIWDHPDLLAAYAAGNGGMDGDRDGVVDPWSLDAPGSAKNVLTVGASESGRPAGSGGESSRTYGEAWSFDFRRPPVSTDLISSSPDDGPQGMAAFSSRGPAGDGRTKPDVVAPGTDIVSARSRASSDTGWGLLDSNTNYCFLGGTSMATPLAAGAATLVRQHCVERLGLAAPSAALIKAALVGGARSLSPGQYGTSEFREIPAPPRPNSVEGWGQIDVSGTLFPTGDVQAVLMEGPALATGGSNAFVFAVHGSNVPLTVALAYSDYPSALSAATHLVNDLDLRLLDPGGIPHYPNGRSEPDALNNVESIDVGAPALGRWTLVVSARNVPQGPQPHALYLRGAIHVPLEIAHLPLENTWVTNAGYLVSADVTSTGEFDPGTVRLVWIATGSTGGFATTTMDTTDGTRFEATLPPQPVGTRIWYYLSAGPPDLPATHPAGAPATLHAFNIVPPLTLTVNGAPADLFAPDPDYGEHVFASNAAIRAVANYPADGTNGWRTACVGWHGTGSVAATGAVNSCDVALTENSGLTWLWQEQVALWHASSPAGAIGATTWHATNSLATGLTAPESHVSSGIDLTFAGWTVDGARWPAGTAPSPRQIAGLPMPTPRLATATYLPTARDSDGSRLPDWFELRHYGQLGQSPYADADGDFYEDELEAADHTDPFDPASHPTPPGIEHEPLATPATSPAPWTVAAVVTDNDRVASVSLHWRRNGGPLRTAAMAGVPGFPDRYETAIPSPARNGDVVAYSISAADAAGFSAQSATWTVTVAYAQISVSPGVLEVSAPAGAATNVVVLIENSGGRPLEIALEIAAVGFADDMESDTNGWTRPDGNADWHLSAQNANSPSNAWYCGLESMRLYRNSTHAALVSPPIQLASGSPRLDFMHRARFEIDEDEFPDGIHYWDAGILEIAVAGEGHWAPLVPEGGYPGLITSNPVSPFAPDTPCFIDTVDWDPVGVELSAYAGQEVQFRFRFGADLYTVAEGWRIDDVVVSPRTAYGDWLAPPATNFSIGAGLSSNLVLELDASFLPPLSSDHLAIHVFHNDPEQTSPIIVPIALHNSSRRVIITTEGDGQAVPVGEVYVAADDPFAVEFAADVGAFIADIRSNSVPLPLPDVVTDQTLQWSSLASNLNLHAIFAPLLDEGSIPPEWLAQYGLTNRNWMAEASLDQDGDGLLTWQEHDLDSNPTNSADARLEVRFVPPPEASNDWRITWHAFTNQSATYAVMSTTNLIEGFVPFTNLIASPPVMTSPPLPPDQRFFGVRKQ